MATPVYHNRISHEYGIQVLAVWWRRVENICLKALYITQQHINSGFH
jgi:hypothetical protein